MRNTVSVDLRNIWEKMSRAAAWHCANSRAGVFPDANRDLREWDEATEEAMAIGTCKDLSQETLDNVKWGIWNGAWHTANRLFGNQGDAQQDLGRWTRHWQLVHEQQDLSTALVDDIRWMAWNFAEWATNVRKGSQFWANIGYDRAVCHASYILQPPTSGPEQCHAGS
ncbi:hypothetical protein WJX74_003887 [Apatococcus lobatus]|uniref:Uncharacterized protein n=1 Tax=Apatococcus lobatus TaxID=904363 RepID=A0AAW1RLE5_9CHLO